MKKLKAVFLFSLMAPLMPLTLFAQFTLTIEIKGLENSIGQVILELSNDKDKQVSAIIQKIENNQCTIVIKNLQPGKYAFKYFHDENKNKNLDQNWFGIPTEGFGFSNNAAGTFGPPSFEKTIFTIEGNKTLKCTPTYY